MHMKLPTKYPLYFNGYEAPNVVLKVALENYNFGFPVKDDFFF